MCSVITIKNTFHYNFDAAEYVNILKTIDSPDVSKDSQTGISKLKVHVTTCTP